MKQFASSRTSQVALALLIAFAVDSATAAEFTGRGIFNFKSDLNCPLSALSGGSDQCNRLALDDADTRATLDPATHKIAFTNPKNYSSKATVGDVLLQGTGQSEEGKVVPLSYHMVLSKSGDKWSVNGHVHAPVRGKFSDVKMDLYQIDVKGKDSQRTVLMPAEITAALNQPSLGSRIASELVQVRDNRSKTATEPDITIAVGASKLSKSVMRARLHTGPVATPAAFAALLKQGTWSVELEALTGQIPDQVAQRELFLYGLDGQALLAPLMKRGFQKHELLTIGAVNGKGYLRFRNQEQEFAGAEAAGRAFLQQSFMGLVLGWQQMENATRVR
jgi:hypothetical protein